MNTYYDPQDLGKFGTIGEDAPELWENFLNIMVRFLKKEI